MLQTNTTAVLVYLDGVQISANSGLHIFRTVRRHWKASLMSQMGQDSLHYKTAVLKVFWGGSSSDPILLLFLFITAGSAKPTG